MYLVKMLRLLWVKNEYKMLQFRWTLRLPYIPFFFIIILLVVCECMWPTKHEGLWFHLCLYFCYSTIWFFFFDEETMQKPCKQAYEEVCPDVCVLLTESWQTWQFIQDTTQKMTPSQVAENSLINNSLCSWVLSFSSIRLHSGTLLF